MPNEAQDQRQTVDSLDMDAATQTKLERCRSLPTLPAVAMKVLELARAEQPNVEEIARTLSSDPALATKILRMVNSPAYSLRFEVTTVRHAISLWRQRRSAVSSR